MRIDILSTQLTEAQTALHDAEARRSAAADKMGTSPKDGPAQRDELRRLTGLVRELRDDVEGLEVAIARARQHDRSDEHLAKRANARHNVKRGVDLTAARIAPAKKIDQAINDLRSAVQSIVASNTEAREAINSYFAFVYQGDMQRRGDATIVLLPEATGEGYLPGAIGQRIGEALQGLNIPQNMTVRDWLRCGELPAGETVQAAAEKAAQRFAKKIDQHVAAHLGSDK